METERAETIEEMQRELDEELIQEQEYQRSERYQDRRAGY